MATRSQRLFGPLTVPTSAADTLLYTAPTGFHVIVKTITMANVAAASRTMRLGIGTTAAGGRIWGVQTINSGGSFSFEAWIVLNPGDELVCLASASASIDVAGFGAVLP